jgi:hypothetical protein
MADPHMFEAYNNLGGHLLVQGIYVYVYMRVYMRVCVCVCVGEAREALPLLEFAYSVDQSEPQLIFNLGLARRQVFLFFL